MEKNKYELNTFLYSFDFKESSYPIIKKLQSFLNFEDKWSYGEGVSFRNEVVDTAIDLSFYLYDNLFTELDAFPGLDGEIMIKTYFPSTAIEIFIDKGLETKYLIEDLDGNELFSSAELSIIDLKKQILSHRQIPFPNQWNLLESSHCTITTKNKKSSQAWHLKTHLKKKEEEFQLFASNVPLIALTAYANTFEQNIQNTPALQFFGSSIQNCYLANID